MNLQKKNNFINKNNKKRFSNATEHNLISKNSKNNDNIGFNINVNENMKYIKQKPNEIILSQKHSFEIYKPKILKTDRELTNYEKKLNEDTYFRDLNNINDEELNTLEYEFAIVYDKRTYFQYYWSLLKKKQLFLFSFL